MNNVTEWNYCLHPAVRSVNYKKVQGDLKQIDNLSVNRKYMLSKNIHESEAEFI